MDKMIVTRDVENAIKTNKAALDHAITIRNWSGVQDAAANLMKLAYLMETSGDGKKTPEERKKIQNLNCIAEIAVPLERFPFDVYHLYSEGANAFWAHKCQSIGNIRKIEELPIFQWKLPKYPNNFGEYIPDFGSWGYDPKPINNQYVIKRFYVHCLTPERDVFGTRKPEEIINEPVTLTFDDGTMIQMKITGREFVGHLSFWKK